MIFRSPLDDRFEYSINLTNSPGIDHRDSSTAGKSAFRSDSRPQTVLHLSLLRERGSDPQNLPMTFDIGSIASERSIGFQVAHDIGLFRGGQVPLRQLPSRIESIQPGFPGLLGCSRSVANGPPLP